MAPLKSVIRLRARVLTCYPWNVFQCFCWTSTLTVRVNKRLEADKILRSVGSSEVKGKNNMTVLAELELVKSLRRRNLMHGRRCLLYSRESRARDINLRKLDTGKKERNRVNIHPEFSSGVREWNLVGSSANYAVVMRLGVQFENDGVSLRRMRRVH